MRKIVATDKAPAAIGPYAQANIFGNLVFTSGQIPIDPATGNLVEGGIEEQTKQVFANIKAVLEEAGSGFDKVFPMAPSAVWRSSAPWPPSPSCCCWTSLPPV